MNTLYKKDLKFYDCNLDQSLSPLNTLPIIIFSAKHCNIILNIWLEVVPNASSKGLT